ncbi:MAG TPA: methylenetetrahydrofolate reductase [Acidimicrobiales bacterium]|jgi:methylenetetrahydrofolate reductase (NADPH)
MARISDLLDGGRTFSIELWPPRSETAERRLEAALAELQPLRPTFTSITYGAGGSTRERTHDLVVRLQRQSDMTAMAHLTCAAHRREELEDVLIRYRDAGVENILALHGDPPLDADSDLPEGDLRYALDLVELARSVGPFCVAVAAHPEGHPSAPDRATDRRHTALKLEAADFAITQFFFRLEDYLDLVDSLAALGVDKPVIPGIMPITSVRTVSRMCELSGTEVPRVVTDRLEPVVDRPDEVRRIGVEVATELGQKLLAEGVPGLHFYTMNQAAATREISDNLGLGPAV